MEQLILRCKKYPKKGSDEWIISGDSIEFRVIEKEKKNRKYAISDVRSSKLKSNINMLALKVEVDGKIVAQPFITFAPDSTDIAQKIHEMFGKDIADMTEEEWVHLINTDDRFIVERERNKRNTERIQRGDKRTKQNEQFDNVLDALGSYIERDVFSEQELQEISALKQYGIDIMNQTAKHIQVGIGLVEQLTAIFNKQTSLKRWGAGEGDAKFIALVEQATELDKQINSVDEQIYALDDKNTVQLENLTKWLELAQQRAK